MKKEMTLGPLTAVLSSEEEITAQVDCREEMPDVWLCRLTLDWPQAVSPQPMVLQWHLPCLDMCVQWDPVFRRARYMPWMESKAFESRLAAWSPMLAFASKSGRSRLTLALSDVKTPIRLSGDVAWPELDVTGKMTFFTGVISPISHYEVTVRIDRRDMRFDDAIRQVTDWYGTLGYGQTHTPDAAYGSTYSTWYAYQQDVHAAQLLKECRAAKRMGMDTIIVDDGWQNVKKVRDYAYCGDWNPAPNRFPDMRAFVDEVHQIGMKVMLWFPVSFIGVKSAAFSRFEGKYLYPREEIGCWVLDPRYQEVREYLVQTYVKAVREWDLDGLKLDYIDRFCKGGDPTDGMDHDSVEDATETLLGEIRDGLRAVKPDILIEFRQPYIGPVIGTYGNMLRVWDCPLDPMTNRLSIADLRLTTAKAAVHSDMVVWTKGDSDESAATHLYATLFGVPQISMRLNTLPASHRRVLSAFLAFRNRHIDTLMKGKFSVRGADSNYAVMQAAKDGERVTMLSASPLIELGDYADEYVINLTDGQELTVVGRTDGMSYEVIDCRGKRIGRMKKLKKQERTIPVPYAAYVHFVK